MPLHDWSETAGWEGVRLLWMAELLRDLKGRLPTGFRAYLGTGPGVAVGAPAARPDVAVRAHTVPADGAEQVSTVATTAAIVDACEPDIEIAVASLEPAPSLYIERSNRLVAAVELISPRNKDRAAARANYASRYAGYLIDGVHLVLVDVHPRPAGFSFADQIAAELQIPNQPSLPPALAVAYRVGEPAATGGRFPALWRRPVAIGAALPTLPLPLGVNVDVPVNLEATYARAAADAYLG